MQIPNTARRALYLIGATTLILAMLLGGIDWYIETEKIDDEVVLLARHEARALTHNQLGRLADPAARDTLAARLGPDRQQNFPIVEIYDADKRLVLEIIAPGRESLEGTLERLPPHGFPFDTEPYYRRISLEHGVYLQVLIPLFDDKERIAGYFEGVYHVPDETLKAIESGLVRAVAMVILAVLLTGGIIYPIILRLNREVMATSRALLRGNLELMEVMGAAIAKRDSDTHAHNYRVTLYALSLGRAAGLADAELRALVAGAFLHDVGKIGIPDAILLKPARLSAEEFETMKQHVALGREILSRATWLSQAIDVATHHHEKYDGSGYLSGLSGDRIPKAARIFAIADVFDALTSRRPYKDAMPPEAALAIMRDDSGRHFDPALFGLFEERAARLHGQIATAEEDALTDRLRQECEALFFGHSGET